MLGDFYSANGCLDGGVVRAGDEGHFGAALFFRVKGIDLRHAATEPDEDAVFGFSFRGIRFCGGLG